jgi:hypothetical protein
MTTQKEAERELVWDGIRQRDALMEIIAHIERNALMTTEVHTAWRDALMEITIHTGGRNALMKVAANMEREICPCRGSPNWRESYAL